MKTGSRFAHILESIGLKSRQIRSNIEERDGSVVSTDWFIGGSFMGHVFAWSPMTPCDRPSFVVGLTGDSCISSADHSSRRSRSFCLRLYLAAWQTALRCINQATACLVVSWDKRTITELRLILLVTLFFFFFLGDALQKNLKALSFQIGLGWNLAILLFKVRGVVKKFWAWLLSAILLGEKNVTGFSNGV